MAKSPCGKEAAKRHDWRDATTYSRARKQVKTFEVMGNAATSSNQESTRVEYFTDEDELAEETEWIRVKNKSKKRKMNTSPTPHQQQQGISEPPQQKEKVTSSPPTDNGGWHKSI